jgi:serine/threonine protein phosphatase 1
MHEEARAVVVAERQGAQPGEVRLLDALGEQAEEAMLWMREPFLAHCDRVDCGRFIVHGHTPQTSGKPDLRRRRVNVDTAAVLGGPLTAAVFDDIRAEPVGFLTDQGQGGGR